MECVSCTACIDACDSVMDKIGRPRGLIRYGSMNTIERGETFKVTARMKLYTGVLCALAAVLLVLIFTRSAVQTTLLRAPGALYQQTADGKINNIYLLKLVNKTSHPMPIQLKLEDIAGKLIVMGFDGELVVPKEDLLNTSVLVELPESALESGNTKFKVGVYSNGKRLQTVNTTFIGPRTIHKEVHNDKGNDHKS
jgi:polyferredoxin